MSLNSEIAYQYRHVRTISNIPCASSNRLLTQTISSSASSSFRLSSETSAAWAVATNSEACLIQTVYYIISYEHYLILCSPFFQAEQSLIGYYLYTGIFCAYDKWI